MKRRLTFFLFAAITLATNLCFYSCSSDIEGVDGELQGPKIEEPVFSLSDFSQVLFEHELNIKETERLTGQVPDSIFYLDHAQLPEWIHKKCHEYLPHEMDLQLAVVSVDDKNYLGICWLWSSLLQPYFFFDEYGNEHQELLDRMYDVHIIAHGLVNRHVYAEHCLDMDSPTDSIK